MPAFRWKTVKLGLSARIVPAKERRSRFNGPYSDRKELADRQDRPDLQVPLDLEVRQARREPWDQWDLPELREQQVRLDLRDQSDQPDLRVLPDLREQRVRLDLRDQSDQRDLQVLSDLRDQRDLRDQ